MGSVKTSLRSYILHPCRLAAIKATHRVCTRGPDIHIECLQEVLTAISLPISPTEARRCYNQEYRADLLDVFASGFNYMSSTSDRILIYSSISPCFAIPPRFCSFTVSQRSFPCSTSSDLLHVQSTVVGPINRA